MTIATAIALRFPRTPGRRRPLQRTPPERHVRVARGRAQVGDRRRGEHPRGDRRRPRRAALRHLDARPLEPPLRRVGAPLLRAGRASARRARAARAARSARAPARRAGGHSTDDSESAQGERLQIGVRAAGVRGLRSAPSRSRDRREAVEPGDDRGQGHPAPVPAALRQRRLQEPGDRVEVAAYERQLHSRDVEHDAVSLDAELLGRALEATPPSSRRRAGRSPRRRRAASGRSGRTASPRCPRPSSPCGGRAPGSRPQSARSSSTSPGWRLRAGGGAESAAP